MPPLPGKAIKLSFSTSPKTLSLRFDFGTNAERLSFRHHLHMLFANCLCNIYLQLTTFVLFYLDESSFINFTPLSLRGLFD